MTTFLDSNKYTYHIIGFHFVEDKSVPAAGRARNRAAPSPSEESNNKGTEGEDAPKRATRSSRSKGKNGFHCMILEAQ